MAHASSRSGGGDGLGGGEAGGEGVLAVERRGAPRLNSAALDHGRELERVAQPVHAVVAADKRTAHRGGQPRRRHFLGRSGVAQLGTDAAVTGRRRRGRRVGGARLSRRDGVRRFLPPATALGRLGLG